MSQCGADGKGVVRAQHICRSKEGHAQKNLVKSKYVSCHTKIQLHETGVSTPGTKKGNCVHIPPCTHWIGEGVGATG